jgi:O-acetyl-ADP-ribose deacetylase (regulator of RNase III)
MLELNDYRIAIALDRPFVAPAPADPGERSALVRSLIEYLQQDGTAGRLGVRAAQIAGSEDSEEHRRLLRALLTIRGPEPLPDDFHRAMDALLQLERLARPTVIAADLPRIADLMPDSPYSGAASVALWQGNITTLAVDAIVNAANEKMLGCFQPFHGCIDNTIHSAAGPRLREDCGRIMQLQGHAEPTGIAKATRGYNLPARFVLHTVGPIVQGSVRSEHETALASCYRFCLDLTREVGSIRSVALCSISTGVFGFPKRRAAEVAVRTVEFWLRENSQCLDLVLFNVFTDEDRGIYESLLQLETPGDGRSW